jgi:hypothetical protein
LVMIPTTLNFSPTNLRLRGRASNHRIGDHSFTSV